MNMKRDVVYYVMPLGDGWLVRAIGRAGTTYARLEDALTAAETLVAEGACVRMLARAHPQAPSHRDDEEIAAVS